MGNLLFLERLDGRDGGIGGIAIVRTTATVELAVEIFWRPGSQTIAPAVKLRLFVQMPVHQHRLTTRALRACRSHLEKQNGCSSRQTNDFQRETRDFLRFDPSCGALDDLVEITRLRPVRIKGGGFGGDLDVVAQLTNEIVVPSLTDRGQDLRSIEHRDGSVHCFSLTLRRQACNRGSV